MPLSTHNKAQSINTLDVHFQLRRSRRLQLVLIVLLLLGTAVLRIVDLSRLPAGFNADEISTLQVTETARLGIVSSFYKVGDSAGGHEGLFPIIETLVTGVIGDGFLCYRIFSVWCGLISIALVFALGRRLFGTYAGFVAALTLGATFWPVLLSRSFSREVLILPLMLGLLLITAHAIHLSRIIIPDSPRTWPFTLIGIFVAILAYTHWTGLIVLPMLLILLGYIRISRQPISRRVFNYSAYSLLLAAILGIPYLTFTLRLLPISGIYTYWVNRPQNVGVLLTSAVQTLLAISFSGDPSWLHNIPYYPLMGPLGALLLVIGLVVAIQRWRAANMGFVLIALLVSLLPDIWSRQAADFNTLTIALPAIALLVGLGAVTCAHRFTKAISVFNMRLVGITALIGLISAASVLYMLFGIWGKAEDVNTAYKSQLGRIAAYLDRNYDNLTTTICTYNLNGTPKDAISDQALLSFMMHNQNEPLRFSDCLNGFVLTSGGATQRVAFAAPDMQNTILPDFQQWIKDGQAVSDGYLKQDSMYTIQVESQLADQLGKLVSGTVDWSPETTGPTEKASLPVRMGGYLTFEGYTLDTTKIYKPGDIVLVVTYWRADGDQIPDLRIFTHILANPKAEPVAQSDMISVEPRLLRDRDIFMQAVRIPLPSPFPDGDYQISVGAYNGGTQERVPVYDNDQPRGDRLFLTQITVKN